jgi:hypothetical protein
MRRVFLVAVASALLMGSAQAQFKPGAKSCGMELQFRPISWNVIQAPSMNLDTREAGGFSAWFLCTEKVELRVNLLFGFGSDKWTITDPLGNNDQLTKTSAGAFGLSLGANYHFNGTARISPYIGGNIGFGLAKGTEKITNWHFVSDNSQTVKEGDWGAQITAVTGFNWFIVDGLYIGAELGLGFGILKPMKTKTTTVIGNNSATNTVNPRNSEWGVDFAATPALRLGWKF